MKVTLQLEDNGPKDKNVLIVGDPAATTKPECDLKIDVTGPTAGTVVELELSQTGSGSAGPSDAKPKVTVGTTKVVKVWGEKASDAIDGKEIAARRKGKKGACATLDLTVIEGLVLHYGGSFEVRLALNPDPTFDPRGKAFTTDPNKFSPTFREGRGYALKDVEPDFDRVIRFSDPVGKRIACRKFVPVTVAKITVVKPKSAETLFATDAVLKEGVNLGKNCWFNELGGSATTEPIDCGGNNPPKGTTADPTKKEDRRLVFKIGKGTFFGKTEKRYFGQSGAATPAFLADQINKALGKKTPTEYYDQKVKDLEAAFEALTAAEKVALKGQNIQRRLKILTNRAINDRQLSIQLMGWVGRYPTDRRFPPTKSDGVIKKSDPKTKSQSGEVTGDEALQEAQHVCCEDGFLHL